MKEIDWQNIGFGYMKCNCNVRAEFNNGAWGEIQEFESDVLNLHISSPSLHYGSQIFEGLKAFRGVDGKIRLFRPDENAKRMMHSAERLCMAIPSEELFVKACIEAVKKNIEFVPPYESGASLYIRPLLIGTGAVLGVSPAEEYLFAVFVSPVGAYFKGGVQCIKVVINTEYDRAAPRGTGSVKCGGNYAASVYPGEAAHHKGFSNVLYLDAVERKYIEECGAANFYGIKDGVYVTPKSPSILRSITNLSLRQIASDLGLKIEERMIDVAELPTFDECGACGTAAVISPIGSVHTLDGGVVAEYGEEVGHYSKLMYDKLQDIQYGRCDDPYGWTVVIE
ncbi:MAG: branched-chain amino acid aminotransferase [Rikenellaceae bacterium]